MIPDWLKKPEIIYTTVLFLISVGIGLYQSEVRGLMKIPGKKIQSRALRRLEGELHVITSLHENSYRLLLWVLWHIVDTAKRIVVLALAANVINTIIGLISGHPLWNNTGWVMILSPALGVLIGHWTITHRIVNGLLRFDLRKAELERDIVLLQGSARQITK